MVDAYLAGLVLTSPDVAKLAAFYTDAMAYQGGWSGESWAGTLGGRSLVIREGAANSLERAIFAVPGEADLGALRARLSRTAVAITEREHGTLGGTALEFDDPNGNRLEFSVADRPALPDREEPITARLQHIVFASPDVRPLLHFYCGVVGFAPSDYVSDDAGDLTSAFLRCSPEHHSVAIFRAPRTRLDHFCYEVGDWLQIRDWADRFAERHITLRWGPGRHGPGNNLFLFINDPDGNWLEVSTELDLIEGGRPVKHWVHEERTLNSWGAAIMRS